MKIIELNDSKIINDLLITFQNSYDTNLFQLFNFLGVFRFFEKKNQNNAENPPNNFKINPKNQNIVFKNNYGFFTDIDLAKVKALSLSINEKIIYIKRQNLNEYLNKFDFFQKGYFTLRQLKTILIDDLEIKKCDLI